ncbi:diamine N-acetyltransferase [Phycisphaerales bacterium]|nr:diamine N-acetyltransferase [Phycisphaerales bacterium]
MFHAPGLAGAIAPDTFTYFPLPFHASGTPRQAAEAFIHARTGDPAIRGFAIVLNTTGQIVGASCFLDIRPLHRGVEIGSTFIAPAHRGTLVNAEAKLLMLTHAFETWGCVRVQLKCDVLNTGSVRAIEKLGAYREGTLRQHMLMPDGRFRDTMMFSILREEWPRIREGLLERLAPRS